jgi:hypothetical protein
VTNSTNRLPLALVTILITSCGHRGSSAICGLTFTSDARASYGLHRGRILYVVFVNRQGTIGPWAGMTQPDAWIGVGTFFQENGFKGGQESRTLYSCSASEGLLRVGAGTYKLSDGAVFLLSPSDPPAVSQLSLQVSQDTGGAGGAETEIRRLSELPGVREFLASRKR